MNLVARPWEPRSDEDLDYVLPAAEPTRHLRVERTESPQFFALPKLVCALHAPKPEPQAWAIHDFWTAGDIGLLVGEDGSYKSTLALHMACAIAGGYPVFGRFETEQRAAAVISQEDPDSVLLNRADAIIRGHGWNRVRVLANLHFLALENVSLGSQRWVSHLLGECERLDVGFIVLDPLAELIDGDENSATDTRRIVLAARELAANTDAAVMLVHHAGKPVEGRRDGDRIRGSSALKAAARCVYAVEKRDDGVLVKPIKLSRAELPQPFLVRHHIVADLENRAAWEIARFDYEDSRTANLTRAEDFVLAQLKSGTRLTTTSLKDAAKGTGISQVDLSKAIHTLSMRHLIDHAGGERGAKLWGLSTLPEDVGQPGGNHLADLA